MDGVLDTHSAWIGRHEVVEVTFDPAVIEYRDLLRTAIAEGCASRAWATSSAQLPVAKELLGDGAATLEGKPRAAKASDQLYYLERSDLAKLPLTPLQARRVNGALHGRAVDPESFLSPRQRDLLERLRAAVEGDDGPRYAAALGKLERPDDARSLAEYARTLDGLLPSR